MKNFGAQRAIDPEYSIPATAWRVDNSSQLKSREIRISLNLYRGRRRKPVSNMQGG